MRRTWIALMLSALVIVAPSWATDGPDKEAAAKEAPAQTAAKKKPAAAAKKPAEKSVTEALSAEVEQLRQMMMQQSQQMEAQQKMMREQQERLNALSEELRSAQTAASSAAAAAQEAKAEQWNAKVTEGQLEAVADVTNDLTKKVAALGQAEVKRAAEDGPATIKYKGINITPGGFLEAATVFRSRAVSGDINTPLTGIPFPGNSLSKVTENNFTGRHSRVTLLVEGKLASAKIGGYYEADFLGAGTTSNNRQSNSYVLRQRQVFGQVAFDNGLSITGGQMWSLAAENRKGIANRGEVPPLVIDPQYSVGFTWARQPGFRVVKSFNHDKFALGFSVEAPQTTIGGRGFSTFTPATGNPSQNFWLNAPGASGGLYNAFDATGYTTNKAPDIIFKAALDPGWGHYEVFGLVSTFRNRVYPCAVVSANAAGVVTAANGSTTTFTGAPITCAAAPAASAPTAVGAFNDSRTGGGGGASFNVPLFSKKLDFGVKAVIGDGIGRYGSAQLSDATARPDGTLALIRGQQALARLEFHPNPKLDAYVYVGNEYAWRAAYSEYQSVKITTTSISNPNGDAGAPVLTNTTVARAINGIGGYGSPLANNSGCSAEAPPTGTSAPGAGGTCAGDIRNILEGSVGFWHKFYQGPKGGLRWGIQYSYLTKSGWSGAAGIQPKAVDNMILTSFRYVLP